MKSAFASVRSFALWTALMYLVAIRTDRWRVPVVSSGLWLVVIIGGTSLFGGAGSVLGTLLGALFMATLKNGMVLMGVSPYSQGVVSGVVIIFAVLLGALQIRRR